MKKEMLKKLKAVILSVFTLGIVLLQCAGAMPVMASDDVISDQFLNSFIKLENDKLKETYFLEYYDKSVKLSYRFYPPKSGGPFFYYISEYTDSSGIPRFEIYLLSPSQYVLARRYNVTGDQFTDYTFSGYLGSVVFKGQNYALLRMGSSSDDRDFNYNLTAHRFTDVTQVRDFMYGRSSYSGELINGSGSGGSSGTYDDSLGYLKNVKCTALVINDKVQDGNSPNEYAGDKKYKLSYSYTTSSGFDLRSSGADVQFYVKIKGGYTTLTGKYHSLPTALSDSYKAGNGNNYFYIGGDSNVSLNVLFGQFRNEASLFAKTIDSTIYVYMRPVSNGKYGGWTRCKFDNGVISGTKNMEVDTGTTKDGTITKENDGEDDGLIIDSSSSSSVASGSGKDFNDAESNASVKPSDGSQITGDINTLDILEIFKSFRSWLSEFVGSFGEFPSLIAKTFPFLPAVITSGISIGFAVSIVLRILGR